MSPARCMAGIESEYGFAVLARDGARVRQERACERLMDLARQRLPHLPGGDRLFLANGSLFYLDYGHHPEVATPECTSPGELVSYVRAGERMLAGLASRLQRSGDLSEVRVFRCNVDLSDDQTTWGCHESYLCRRSIETQIDQLLPHLVSRLVYTGAGGLDSKSRGVSFSLSPRVSHLTRTVSGDSTRNRGIAHTKDEPLSGHGYHRLHLLCGDSTCSELATWLKVGTTALVVALTDAGDSPGAAVALRDPLQAMRRFARDVRCRDKAPGAASRARLSALVIQRHYLEQVERRLGSDVLPAWAGTICARWRQVLDRIEHDPTTLAGILDWPTKLALFENRARSAGLRLDGLASLNAAASALHAVLESVGESVHDLGVAGIEQARRRRGALDRALGSVDRRLVEARSDWNGLTALLDLRQDLGEMDVRYGDLGPDGLFSTLDDEGVLEHRVTTDAEIEQALRTPPETGRAHVRGNAIAKLAGRACGYACGWDRITGPDTVLDLANPFETEERWRPADTG